MACLLRASGGAAFRGLRVSASTSLRHSRAVATLPLVDIAPFMPGAHSNPGAKLASARSLDTACQNPGFFYLVGHGAPAGDLQELHHLAKEFFSLPVAVKEEIALFHNPTSGRGYQRLGENVTLGKRDWHEAIDFYAEPAPQEVDLEALCRAPAEQSLERLTEVRPFVFGFNVWPASPAGLQTSAVAHFGRMSVAGRALMECMALAFGLPPDHFDTLVSRSFWCARIIGYPPLQDASSDDLGISCGEHTDYGCWTLLAQDDTRGALEAQMSDGSWAPVDPVPGALVVNLGDMLSVWTQGRFAATPHRVRHCRRDRYRTSVAFFFEPNFDAEIHPLDIRAAGGAALPGNVASTSVASTGPLRRAMQGGSLVYGEHLYAKVSNNFQPLG